VGVYSVGTSTTLVFVTAACALLGYVFGKLGCETAPFLLGFVLGPLMEENLRRSMAISFGSPMVFIERPISAALLAATLVLVAMIVVPQFRKTREEAF
jgi:putative tricarboxylic transport membrane protein